MAITFEEIQKQITEWKIERNIENNKGKIKKILEQEEN